MSVPGPRPPREPAGPGSDPDHVPGRTAPDGAPEEPRSEDSTRSGLWRQPPPSAAPGLVPTLVAIAAILLIIIAVIVAGG